MTMMHQYGEWDGKMQMMEALPITLTKGKKVEFKPGDLHIMAMEPAATLKPGDKVKRVSFKAPDGEVLFTKYSPVSNKGEIPGLLEVYEVANQGFITHAKCLSDPRTINWTVPFFLRDLERLAVGDCFVFDYRTALNPQLQPTENVTCFACRAVVTPEAQQSPSYVAGKSCPACVQAASAA